MIAISVGDAPDAVDLLSRKRRSLKERFRLSSAHEAGAGRVEQGVIGIVAMGLILTEAQLNVIVLQH